MAVLVFLLACQFRETAAQRWKKENRIVAEALAPPWGFEQLEAPRGSEGFGRPPALAPAALAPARRQTGRNAQSRLCCAARRAASGCGRHRWPVGHHSAPSARRALRPAPERLGLSHRQSQTARRSGYSAGPCPRRFRPRWVRTRRIVVVDRSRAAMPVRPRFLRRAPDIRVASRGWTKRAAA